MIGEGVLLECLKNPLVTDVLSVSRKPIGIKHPKLKEYLMPDFLLLSEDDNKLKGYDTCFYCAGVSSAGMKEEEYRKITYDTTLHFAKVIGPNSNMTFIYVSGGGTDSSEKRRMMWARVKGKTENDLIKLSFKQVFGFRIGFVKPAKGQKKVHKYYKYVSWLFPAITVLFPNIINTMKEVTDAMIYLSQNGYERNVIYVKDIHHLAKKALK